MYDFDLSAEERQFEQEVEAFLQENWSPDVMDAQPMKREFLPRINRGEIEFAIGYSERGLFS